MQRHDEKNMIVSLLESFNTLTIIIQSATEKLFQKLHPCFKKEEGVVELHF